LVGEEYLTHAQKRKIENIDYDRGQLFWGGLAIHELPNYIAAQSNPDMNKTPSTYWGVKDPEYMANKYQAEIALMGFASSVYCCHAQDSRWDPSRAPKGKHCLQPEEMVAANRFHSPSEWKKLRDDWVDNYLIPQWQTFAPNMTKENVIAHRIYTPNDVLNTHKDMIEGSECVGAQYAWQSGRYRPSIEFSSHRTFIKGLYICSSALHSGMGIGRGSSYICYKLIAEDLGLPPVKDKYT
jgi:phytoene dehydrogenase-like protein